jgi:hypothetical protein
MPDLKKRLLGKMFQCFSRGNKSVHAMPTHTMCISKESKRVLDESIVSKTEVMILVVRYTETTRTTADSPPMYPMQNSTAIKWKNFFKK